MLASRISLFTAGIRLTPAQIVNAAPNESVHVVDLSTCPERTAARPRDMERLRERRRGGARGDGVARLYTPQDFDLHQITLDILGLAGAEYHRAA